MGMPPDIPSLSLFALAAGYWQEDIARPEGLPNHVRHASADPPRQTETIFVASVLLTSPAQWCLMRLLHVPT